MLVLSQRLCNVAVAVSIYVDDGLLLGSNQA